MYVLTLINCIVLAMDRFPISPDEVRITDLINITISFIFMLEMVIKLFGLGFKEYSRDRFNLLDAIIVCFSIIDISL